MANQDMTKKKKRNLDLTRSSSSEKMELSKPPKDVLGLGRHLVRELGFDDGMDTLGSWMAHHLAELMNQAENGSNSAIRSKAKKAAMETILEIWEHRASLPGRAYPITPYKDVLQVLDHLKPTENPFPYFRSYGGSKRDELSTDLFDSLTRLVIALLLMKIPPDVITGEIEPAALEALGDEEFQALEAILKWRELFESAGKSIVRTGKGERNKQLADVNLGNAAIKLIDSLSATLDELRSDLEK